MTNSMDILYIKYVVYRDAVVAQSVARRLGKAEVTGSSPANSLKTSDFLVIEVRCFLFVRAKPCLPLCSFSLIRKTKLWETNKPPAMQVSSGMLQLTVKNLLCYNNVGSPTALKDKGGYPNG